MGWMIQGSFPGGKSSRGMNLTTNPHLVPSLRMNGAVPLLPLCAFMDRDSFTFTVSLLESGSCHFLGVPYD